MLRNVHNPLRRVGFRADSSARPLATHQRDRLHASMRSPIVIFRYCSDCFTKNHANHHYSFSGTCSVIHKHEPASKQNERKLPLSFGASLFSAGLIVASPRRDGSAATNTVEAPAARCSSATEFPDSFGDPRYDQRCEASMSFLPARPAMQAR